MCSKERIVDTSIFTQSEVRELLVSEFRIDLNQETKPSENSV